MKTRIACLGAILLLAAPTIAIADAGAYTYLGGRYILAGDIETRESGSQAESTEYTGFTLTGSIGLTETLFITAEYSALEPEWNNGNGEIKLLSGGIGVRIPVGSPSNPADVFGVVSYESIDYTTPNSEAEANGYGLTAGIRWAAADHLELSPYITYLDYGEVEQTNTDLDGLQYGVKGVYSLSHAFAITASYRSTELDFSEPDSTTEVELGGEFSVGLRYYFATAAPSP